MSLGGHDQRRRPDVNGDGDSAAEHRDGGRNEQGVQGVQAGAGRRLIGQERQDLTLHRKPEDTHERQPEQAHGAPGKNQGTKPLVGPAVAPRDQEA
nr:hypothetical protein BJQ95_00230 [Cryobacterium sp. SO1]